MTTAPLPAIAGPRPALFLVPQRLNDHLGLDLTLASETLQHTGSFKFRGAFNYASRSAAPHLLAVSSGNFGQALALACRLRGKRCTVVMPHDALPLKVDAVRSQGALVELVDTRVTPRFARLAELAAAHPDAEVAYPSDGEPMLAGNEDLGIEVLAHAPFDAVIAPIGGGGIVVGLIRAARRLAREVAIWAAEPTLANDTAQSFRAGERVALREEPTTLADGTRTLALSPANWALIRDGCRGVIEVDEAQIADATRLLFTHANLKAEPTAALAVGAALARPDLLRGQRVCCLVTGANADPAVYARLLAG